MEPPPLSTWLNQEGLYSPTHYLQTVGAEPLENGSGNNAQAWLLYFELAVASDTSSWSRGV